MTKFESVGVNMQIESASTAQAIRRFSNSCDICALRGLRIECDCCAIREAHRQVVANFRDLRDIERDHIDEVLKSARDRYVPGAVKCCHEKMV